LGAARRFLMRLENALYLTEKQTMSITKAGATSPLPGSATTSPQACVATQSVSCAPPKESNCSLFLPHKSTKPDATRRFRHSLSFEEEPSETFKEPPPILIPPQQPTFVPKIIHANTVAQNSSPIAATVSKGTLVMPTASNKLKTAGLNTESIQSNTPISSPAGTPGASAAAPATAAMGGEAARIQTLRSSAGGLDDELEVHPPWRLGECMKNLRVVVLVVLLVFFFFLGLSYTGNQLDQSPVELGREGALKNEVSLHTAHESASP
jgi:hypothetical protein